MSLAEARAELYCLSTLVAIDRLDGTLSIQCGQLGLGPLLGQYRAARSSAKAARTSASDCFVHFNSGSATSAACAIRSRNMPIRSSLERDHSFGPEDIARLSAAFETALGKLGLVDRKDPATTAVAKLIIELAKEGERDPERLCALALKQLSK